MADDRARSTSQARRRRRAVARAPELRRTARPSPGAAASASLHPTATQLRRRSCARLRDEGYSCASTSRAVDYLAYEPTAALPDGVAPERFEVVVALISHAERDRLRLRVQVPEDDPVVPVAVRAPPRHRGHRARGLRHVRHRVRRPPRPHPHPHARGLGGPPAAQGLRLGRIPVQFKGAPPMPAERQADDHRARPDPPDRRGRARRWPPRRRRRRRAAARARRRAAHVRGRGRRARRRGPATRTRR